MRVLDINNCARKYPNKRINNSEFLSYWCMALSPFRGFELIFKEAVTDLAWAALQPSLDVKVITWIIKDSGIEHYFDATLIMPGCGSQSIVVLIPKIPSMLIRLYKRGLGGARFINCPIPRYETYVTWANIVDGLVNTIGIDELLNYALKHLFGFNEDRDEEYGGPRGLMHELT